MKETDWPRRNEVLVCAGVALLLTVVDTMMSREVGLLAYPLFYDGAGWMLDAKQSFLRIGASFDPSVPEAIGLRGTAESLLASRTPLWQVAFMLNWVLLGVGEWQAYTVRFWPIFLILLAIVWVARRRVSPRFSWVALVLASLVPTIAVGTRAFASEALSGTFLWGQQWFLADLRPDLLSAALALWAVISLVEHGPLLPRSSIVVSAVFFVAALLVKPSTSPLLVIVMGSVALYVLWQRRSEWRGVIRQALIWMAVVVGLLLPWIVAGGLRGLGYFLKQSFTVQRTMWANPDATLWSEVSYYLRLIPIHLGWESVILIVVGISLFAGNRSLRQQLPGLSVYLFLGVVLFAAVVTTPNKNMFLGLPSSVFLLLFSLVVIGSGAYAFKPILLEAGVGIFVAGLLVTAAVGLSEVDPIWKTRGAQDRAAVAAIVSEIEDYLRSDGGCFAHPPLYGSPATFQFDMSDRRGVYPSSPFPSDDIEQDPPSEYLDLVRDCGAVVTFGEPIQDDVSPMPAARKPYFELIRRWALSSPSMEVALRTEMWGNRSFNLEASEPVEIVVLVREESDSAGE